VSVKDSHVLTIDHNQTRENKNKTQSLTGTSKKWQKPSTRQGREPHLCFLWHPGDFGKEKVTNEKVREGTALPKLEGIIRCRRLRRLGHLSRMDHHRLLQQALTWEPEGFRRRPVRPRQNWKDVVKKDHKWASAGTKLKKLRRTGGILSPNTSLTQDDQGTRLEDGLVCSLIPMPSGRRLQKQRAELPLRQESMTSL